MGDFFSSDDEPTQVFPAIDGGGPTADHSRQGVAETPVDLGKLSPWSAQPETSFDAPPAAAEPDPYASQTTALADPVEEYRPVEEHRPVEEYQPVDTHQQVEEYRQVEYLPTPTPGTVLPAARSEEVTCPACGTVAMVTLTRRDSADFCRNCDYPLFWTPSKIVIDRSGMSEDSLRRLPGTVGRVTVASFPCPYCAEPNQVTAIDCVRCGRPLRPVHFVPPPPLPRYEPEPDYEPEPEERLPLWVWALILGMVFIGVLVIVAAFGGFD